jgi:hypothetical protein
MTYVWAGGVERFYESEGYDPHSSNVLRMVGYFSLVGLLRVHSLIGDYSGALTALHPINPFKTVKLFTPKIAGVCPLVCASLNESAGKNGTIRSADAH